MFQISTLQLQRCASRRFYCLLIQILNLRKSFETLAYSCALRLPRVIPLSCLLDKLMVIAFWLQHLHKLLCLLYSTDTVNSEPLQWRLKWLAQLVLKGVRLDVTSSAVCFSGWCYAKCLFVPGNNGFTSCARIPRLFDCL